MKKKSVLLINDLEPDLFFGTIEATAGALRDSGADIKKSYNT